MDMNTQQYKKSNANPSIECSVTQCEYHSDRDQYCALNAIKVGTHETNPTVPQCTDCESFKAKG